MHNDFSWCSLNLTACQMLGIAMYMYSEVLPQGEPIDCNHLVDPGGARKSLCINAVVCMYC